MRWHYLNIKRKGGGIESTEQLQNKESLAKTKITQIDFTQASSHTHLAQEKTPTINGEQAEGSLLNQGKIAG